MSSSATADDVTVTAAGGGAGGGAGADDGQATQQQSSTHNHTTVDSIVDAVEAAFRVRLKPKGLRRYHGLWWQYSVHVVALVTGLRHGALPDDRIPPQQLADIVADVNKALWKPGEGKLAVLELGGVHVLVNRPALVQQLAQHVSNKLRQVLAARLQVVTPVRQFKGLPMTCTNGLSHFRTY